MRLSDRFVDNAKAAAGRTEYNDEIQPGLVLRVTPNGARTFAATYYRDGKRQRVTLGPADVLSLNDARQQAADIRARVLRGEHPAAERRASRALSGQQAAMPAQTSTLHDLIEAYASAEGRRATRKALPRGWDEYSRTIEHVFAPLLDAALADINEDRLKPS